MLPASSLRPLDVAALHVAGIGASAGGIEAMLPMFAHLPATGRIAYVVAQHMAHNGHSDLVARLLGRESALPVMLARDGERLQPDTVYVIPAGKDGCMRDGCLDLQAPGSGNLSTPSVNVLFASIGEASRERAVGIVLSGTGTDGTAGCRAIRSRGGLTIAQEPAEAKFDGMPGAAIEARVIDRVLPVEAIGDALAELFPAMARPPAPPVSSSGVVAGPALAEPALDPAQLRELERLLQLVHEATGIDFSSYKEETLLRRLEKRKATLGIASAEDYLALVRRQPDELRTLQQHFLVSVSSFFRDRDSFRELERALAAVVAGKCAGEPLRVWVPGCATGDECYSLAIVLAELLGPYHDRHAVQITGTDINTEALATAREGVYRQTALGEVEEGLRERYFVARGQHFEVTDALRECVKFEQRDVLAGPPATGLDLVSCRNLLIYLKSRLQDQLIGSFHQALRPQGLLFVGLSESLGVVGDSLFVAVDRYHRLFRRRE